MNRKLDKSFGCLLVTLLVLVEIAIFPVKASPGPKVYLSPSSYVFDTTNATIGTKFNVTVWVSNPTYPWDLMMWQAYLTYDDSIINTTDFSGEVTGKKSLRVWPSDDLDGRLWDSEYVFYKMPGGAIGNPTYYHFGTGSGAIKVGDTLMGEREMTAAKKLMVVEFEVKAIPAEGKVLSCTLGINNADTFLFDFAGRIPNVVKQDGNYRIEFFVPEDTTPPTVKNVHHVPVYPANADVIFFYADVTDNVGVSLVQLNYTADGGTSWNLKEMFLLSGSTYNASLGPYPNGQLITYYVVAFDAKGNKGISPSATIRVSPPLGNLDVNGDRKIDMQDLYFTALAFGTRPGYPRWDPKCDVNNNGLVDLVDMILIALDFGKIIS